MSYPPLGLGRDDAANYVGVGTTKFDQMVKDGRMPQPREIDSRILWDRTEVEVAFRDLPHRASNEDENPWRNI